MTTVQTPPPVKDLMSWRFPAYRESRLDNDLRVLAYQCRGQHVASASLVFDVPLSVERADIEGVAELTARCLSRGTDELTAEEFSDELAACGAELEASASLDAFVVRLTAPLRHLDRALQLMADAVVRPALDETEVTHERTLRLQEIDQAHAYPQHVANEQLNSALFGTARAARPVGGSAETVAAIARADVAEYAGSTLSPQVATLVLAGDFDGAPVDDMTARAFGSWSKPAGARATPEQPSLAGGARLLLVDWPDAPQSTVRVAGPGITRGDSRWPALFVANHALGGSFSSRINTVLREEKGFTYGATSMLDSSRHSGVFSLSTAVTTPSTAEAITDILHIVADAAGSLTDEEVTTGVRAVTSSAPLGYERSEAVSGRVELLLSQQLALDHVDANLRRIRDVTTTQANTAYADVIDPSSLTVLVVGDAAATRPGLTGIGYTDLQEVTPDWR